MTNDTSPPIEVRASPWVDQAWAALRQIAPPIVAFLIGRHLIPDDVAALVLAIVGGVALPITVGQFKTRLRAQQLATVAKDPAVPQHVIVTK